MEKVRKSSIRQASVVDDVVFWGYEEKFVKNVGNSKQNMRQASRKCTKKQGKSVYDVE